MWSGEPATRCPLMRAAANKRNTPHITAWQGNQIDEWHQFIRPFRLLNGFLQKWMHPGGPWCERLEIDEVIKRGRM